MFFLEQANVMMQNVISKDVPQRLSLLLVLLILTPLSLFKSMRSISFISLAAMISIFMALFYIVIDDAYEFANKEKAESLSIVNLAGIPYYFGTAMFMFEGNAVALEIYH